MNNNNKQNFFTFFPLVLNLILFLFLGSFLEDTAFMEADIEVDSNTTWKNWIYNNKENILIYSSVFFLTGIAFYFGTDLQNVNIINNVPQINLQRALFYLHINDVSIITDPNIQILLENFKPLVKPPLFDEIYKISHRILFEEITNAYNFERLSNLLFLSDKNTLVMDNIINQKNFTKVLTSLIEELEKIRGF